MKRKQKTEKQLLEIEAEQLWKEACLKMWGDDCLLCHNGTPANTFHHFVPRSKCIELKYDVMNGIPVCPKHHSILHGRTNNPLDVAEAVEFIKKKRGKEWCDYIEKKRKGGNTEFDKIKGTYINRTVKWLQGQVDKLKDYLNY